MRSDRIRRCSASPEGKPRSRKTLPLERVTLSFMGLLPFGSPASAPSQHQGAQPVSGKIQVPL